MIPMKTMSAQELEQIGIPFNQDVILDMWHNDDPSVTIVFKLEGKFYSVDVNFYIDQFPWHSFYTDENAIPLKEMEAQQVEFTRFVPIEK